MASKTRGKKTPRASAKPGDLDYLLRDLNITPLRFRVNRGPRTRLGSIADSVVAFVNSHPGSTISDLRANVPALSEWEYDRARAVVVGLVDGGVLSLDGQVPIEEVDLRYERIGACDLCGSPSQGHDIVFWKHNTPVVRCSRCGLLYANPRWKAEHLFGRYNNDEYWAEYAQKIRHTALDPAANLARWSGYLAELEIGRQTGRSTATLLDVGCSTGEFMVAAQARGWEVYGIELSPQAAERARWATGARVEVGTLDDVSYPDGWFDAVTLWDVLEHLQSPRSHMARIARLVRLGGAVALTTPNIRSVAYMLLGPDWRVVGPNEHIYYFSPRTLSRLFINSGLSIHAMRTLHTPLDVWQQWLHYPVFDWLARWLNSATPRVSARFLLGDELHVVARRR